MAALRVVQRAEQLADKRAGRWAGQKVVPLVALSAVAWAVLSAVCSAAPWVDRTAAD
jgi:hypothetical protein